MNRERSEALLQRPKVKTDEGLKEQVQRETIRRVAERVVRNAVDEDAQLLARLVLEYTEPPSDE